VLYREPKLLKEDEDEREEEQVEDSFSALP